MKKRPEHKGNTAQFQVVERAGKFWRDTPPEPLGVNYAVLPKMKQRGAAPLAKRGPGRFSVPGKNREKRGRKP